MYRQLVALTLGAAAFAAGAAALGPDRVPSSRARPAPAVELAPAPALPLVIPTVEIDPNYFPQPMNYP